MKFPKSMHAEGWLNHIEPTTLGHMPKGMKNDAAAPKAIKPPKADTRVRLDTPIGGADVAPELRTPGPARRSKVSPWLIGAGAGVALIGLAVSMSHNLSSVEPPAAPPPAVAAKTLPQPTLTPSPEDTQLANAPTAAGPQATPAVEARPEAEPPKVAAAPVEPTPKAQASQPVAKTLTPKAEAPVAQVAPPAALRGEPAAKPTTPEAATPPMAQQQPQQPAQADPEDAGITIKVRAALAADAVLSAVPIAVSTDHGIVKLEGQAPDAQAREHATVVASSTTGVKGVDNRLTLPPVAQVQPEPRESTQQGS